MMRTLIGDLILAVLAILFIHFWNNRAKQRTIVVTCPKGHQYRHEIKYGVFSVWSFRVKGWKWAESHRPCMDGDEYGN